jgi:hypothetical protein
VVAGRDPSMKDCSCSCQLRRCRRGCLRGIIPLVQCREGKFEGKRVVALLELVEGAVEEGPVLCLTMHGRLLIILL